MVNLYMIDTNSMGIPMMYQVQREKCFPLPTYDLEEVNRVKVTLYGKILDKNYTQLLHSNNDLDLHTVFLLDKVQKKETISKEDYQLLRKAELVEGRYPNIFVSFAVASMVGTPAEYVKNKGLKNDVYKQIIKNALLTMGKARVSELREILDGSFPNMLDERQKSRKVSNLLHEMKKDHIVDCEGKGQSSRWFLTKNV